MQNWEIKTLQEVCTMKITDGTHQTPKYCEKEDGGFPFISSKNVTKEFIDWSDIKYIVPELHESLYKRIAPQKNDVLLAKNGTTGVAALVEDDRIFDIYVTLAVLRPNTKIINPKYLLKIVNSPLCKVQFDAHLKGIGVPNLHLEEIQKVQIPLPPLEEQKRIVSILDRKFAMLETVKENAKTNLQNTKDLFQSQLTKAFSNTTWEKKRFSEIIKLSSGDYLNSKSIIHGEYAVYGGNGIIDYHNQYNLDGKNIIIGRVGALCGNVRYIKEKIWLTDNAFKVDFINCNFDYQFITYLLNFKNLRSFARQAAQPVISNSSLKDLPIPLPPLTEQKRIVEQLDSLSAKVRRLEEIYTKQLADCDELKQAFLAKAFNGEL